MSMFWQLAHAKRRGRHSEPRPTIELMPSISIHDLRHVIPRYHGQVNEPNVDLKYPGIARLRLFASHIEITGRNGYIQRFRIVWIRTGFGKHRAILVCSSCGGGAIRLFGHYGNYACRFCHRAVYASQKNNQIGRPRLQASKLRLIQLGGWPDIREPLPPKPKWTRHRTYQRIRNEIQVLEATANSRRFRKPIPTQLFAYHVG
jgi:hypothetical protein